MELLGHLLYPSHLLRKKGRILCFVEFITMLSTLPRIVGPFRGIFTKSLGRGPWSSPKRNPLPNHKGKGVVAVVIHGNSAKVEEPEGSFHLSTVRTPQKNPKFKSLFNQLGFGPKARKMAIESLMSIATDSRGGMFHSRISCQLSLLGDNQCNNLYR